MRAEEAVGGSARQALLPRLAPFLRFCPSRSASEPLAGPAPASIGAGRPERRQPAPQADPLP